MILWGDGFDQYGLDRTALAAFGYALSGFNNILSNVNPRTGSTSLRFVGGGPDLIKRTISAPSPIIGCGAGVFIAIPPPSSDGLQWNLYQGATDVLAIVITPGLGFEIRKGTFGAIIQTTANNLLTLNTYQWIEFKYVNDTVTPKQTLEVRLNGNVLFTINGLGVGNLNVDAVQFSTRSNMTVDAFYDDWVLWDGTGTLNNNFLGPRRCNTSLANSDGATQQWTIAGAATANAALNSTPPDVTKSITGTVVNQVADIGKAGLTRATNDIAGIILSGNMLSSDGSAVRVRMGMNSAGTVLNAPEITLGSGATYYQALFETDPATGLSWTKTGLDAALMRLTRTF